MSQVKPNLAQLEAYVDGLLTANIRKGEKYIPSNPEIYYDGFVDIWGKLNEIVADSMERKLDAPEIVSEIRTYLEATGHRIARDFAAAVKPAKRELYEDRIDRREDAVMFLRRVWQTELEAELLDQDILRKADVKLMTALDNRFRGRRDELQSLVPSRETVVTKECLKAGLDPGNRADRRTISSALAAQRKFAS